MLKSHEQFYSANGRRQILVIDDEPVNRELLKAYLEDKYEVRTAQDGAEGLALIRELRDTLSLILLDLMMPVLDGVGVLKELRGEPELARIPVIVLTADQKSEIECLELGAADFIPKPYPDVGVVLARIQRTIELSEDREIIESTERDALTGLYNREYFYRYAEQYDHYHADQPMDAVVLDVNHFHMINERYGKAYGDGVLQRIGERAKAAVRQSGGLVCRREADTFLIYWPHREDYEKLMEEAAEGLGGEESSGGRVRLRMGIYPNVDKRLDIERRFDRAKAAADTIKGNFTKTAAFYDRELHERELYSEQLIEDFDSALKEEQFTVFYQPKYDVRGDVPSLASAEALVRWNHPKLGMVSPAAFIPLFEENGMIRQLDRYVWRRACAQMRDWKERLGVRLPVSVNVSRIDLYDPDLVPSLDALVKEYGLSAREDLLLEITESAYTQDSGLITETVNRLRDIGFRIEMDDFGTGYSSLNMVSSLPFDILKLDMQFTRSAFREGGDTRMLELIVDIAEYLSVPVIAEGVETEEQMNALKTMGCDYAQGYYFSRPVSAEEFEVFFREKKAAGSPAGSPEAGTGGSAVPKTLRSGLSEIESETGEAFRPDALRGANRGLPLRTAAVFFVIIALLAAAALFASALFVSRGYRRMVDARERYLSAQTAAADLESGSDDLTDLVRCFVVTGKLTYLDDFFNEVNVVKRRDRAVEELEELLAGSGESAIASLNSALALSNELVGIEYRAMRLKLESGGYDLTQIPDEIASADLTAEDLALTKEEMNEKAQTLVFDETYMRYKEQIREQVGRCTEELIRAFSQELDRASSRMAVLVSVQTVTTVIFLIIVFALVIYINEMVRKPLKQMVGRMRSHEEIPPSGAAELQFVARTYNGILADNKAARERLSHEASHDALTGLFNRGAYDMLMQSVDTSHIALLIVDIDRFKSVNDTYGHAVGDRVLKRVAEILKKSFRSVDLICRIGGDEFAVVMTRVNSSMRQLVINKIDQANELLQHPKDDLPAVSLSVGAAFSDREDPQGDIFIDADTALYRVKNGGGAGCSVY